MAEEHLAFVHAIEAPEAPDVSAQRLQIGARDYRTGVVVGVTAFAIAVEVWLAVALGRLTEFAASAPSRSAMVNTVTAPWWRWGAVIGLSALAFIGHVAAGRGKKWPIAVAATLTAVVVGLTAYAISYRVNELT
jgi:hypothetical protein